MTFDEYWASTWKETAMPGVMDMAFREVAEKAWNAALEEDRKIYEKIWNTSVRSDSTDEETPMDSFDLHVTHLRSRLRDYLDQPGLVIEIWLSPILVRTHAKESIIEMLERALDISPLADAFINEYIRELKLEIEDERWEELA